MAIYNVATQKQLETAIAGLKNGDTILLAGGQYDLIKMRTTTRQDHSFEQKVTIASADPNNPAVVSELIMASVDNVTFSGVKFDYNPAKPSSKPFFVEKSSRVVFDNVTFEGEIVNGFGAGQGLRAKDSSQVTVVNSHFVNFQNALSFSNMSDVALLDNDVRGMSNDGFTFGGMTRILIAGNDFRDYESPQPLAPHKDNIQFRTASGETASTDVVIRENVMVVDEARHGIFLGNEAYRDGNDASVHTNVLIEHNTLSTAQTHGITVFQADRLDIRDNILTKNPGMPLTDKLYTPIINVSKYSTHVLIQGNQVASVQTPQNETWTVAGNLVSGQRYLHWDGTLEMVNAGSRGLIIPPDPVDPEGEIFRFDGKDVQGLTLSSVAGLDFGRGDEIYLHGFDPGVFQGVTGGNSLEIWEHGGAVRIDSALDLQELSDISPLVTGRTNRAGTLTLIITESDGQLQIELPGMAAAWAAADRPDLY